MKSARLLALALALLAPPPPALAAELSAPQVSALATRAQESPRALAELRRVTSVDGVAVDLEAALAGAQGAELEARLAELERSAAGFAEATPRDAADARAQASEALAGDEPPPQPSGGGPDSAVPFGLTVVLAALALAAGALAARAVASRRVVEPAGGGGGGTVRGHHEAVSAGALERAADDAERGGDFAEAVRLRFRAGLLRLEERGALLQRPSLTAPGAARELGSPVLAGLAATYDAVVFGQQPAGPPDAEAARSGWRRVLGQARPGAADAR